MKISLIFVLLIAGPFALASETKPQRKPLHVTCYESKLDVTEVDAKEVYVDAWTPQESAHPGELHADNILMHGSCSVRVNLEN